jgi:hypothetical protein
MAAPIALMALCVALAGCQTANSTSIERRTILPRSIPTGPYPSNGVAIHLDAQQRLLLYGPDGKYCAEPSPDALASFAASLGLAASVPGTGAGSAAGAFNSAAASIGLRTQSITLMRDALYRICEATANGTLKPVDAALLLTRSQDLTAVVVAVEQLTGAVAANQAALTGSANSAATAELLTDQVALEAANKEVTTKENELTAAKNEQSTETAQLATKQTAANTAAANYKQAMDNPPPATAPQPDLPKLMEQANTADQELAAEKLKKQQADDKAANATLARDNAIANRQAIENHQNSLRTAVNASAATAAQFSSVAARNQLSSEATQYIAEAVNKMVARVLAKNYTIEACTLLISNNQLQPGGALDMCYALISATAQFQASQLLVQAYSFNDLSMKIETFWMPGGVFNPQNAQKIQACMDRAGIAGSITLLVNAGTELQKAAVVACLRL